MTGHRLLSDADLEPVSDAQLQAAIAVVLAMTEDEFEYAARSTGRDPLAGMSPVREARLRARGLL